MRLGTLVTWIIIVLLAIGAIVGVVLYANAQRAAAPDTKGPALDTDPKPASCNQPEWPSDDPDRTKYVWDAENCEYDLVSIAPEKEDPKTAIAAKKSDPAADAAPKLEYSINDNVVTVTADGTMIARVTFTDKTNQVDNNHGEWLKDRWGIGFLYQSAVGNAVTVKVELFDNAAFAADGDAFDWGSQDFGKANDADDVIILADQKGTYTFTGHSFGLAIAAAKDDTDKAGWALLDRRNATNNDGRPEWWIPADGASGDPVQINK